jgi:hypothetical protein
MNPLNMENSIPIICNGNHVWARFYIRGLLILITDHDCTIRLERLATLMNAVFIVFFSLLCVSSTACPFQDFLNILWCLFTAHLWP